MWVLGIYHCSLKEHPVLVSTDPILQSHEMQFYIISVRMDAIKKTTNAGVVMCRREAHSLLVGV